MRRKLAVLLSVLLFSGLFILYQPTPNYAAATGTATAIQSSLAYLAATQNTDGGFPSEKGRSSSKINTAWVVMALRASGEDVTATKWTRNGNNPLDYLTSGTTSITATTDYARILLALQAAGADGSQLEIDLTRKILSFQQSSGQFAQLDQGEEDMINAHMWSILALTSAGCEIPQKDKAKTWLLGSQNIDGGFGWARGLESDPDDTAVALTTLIILGEAPSASAMQKAIKYLDSQETVEGGFVWAGQKSNTATISWVIQGLSALGADTGKHISHLLSYQNSEGFFNWTKDLKSQPVLMTAYALMALQEKPIPVNIDFAALKVETLNIRLTIDSNAAFVNGRIKLLDVPPVIIKGLTYVPLRFVGEYLGAEVTWDSQQAKAVVIYGGDKFDIQTGSKASSSAPYAIIEKGRALVPLRYISEKLKASVWWDEKERRIEIER